MWLERNIRTAKNYKMQHLKAAKYLVHSRVGQKIK